MSSTCFLRSRASERNENLRVCSASMRSEVRRFRRGVHVSLLDEKSRSQGTAEACAGSMSIASRKRNGNLLSAPCEAGENHEGQKKRFIPSNTGGGHSKQRDCPPLNPGVLL